MNLRTIPTRLGSSFVIVVGVAGVVGVLTALLAMAEGFEQTLTSAGAPDRALVMRESSQSELSSGLSQAEVDVIANAPGVARDAAGRPIYSAEVLVVSDVPKRSTGEDANLSVRGVGLQAPALRTNFEIIEGRMFEPGRAELIAGRGASLEFAGLEVGDTLQARGSDWEVVGIFTTQGDASESEVWVDAPVAQGAFRRGNSYQSVRAKLQDELAFAGFKAALADDQRVKVQVDRESDYYASLSGGTSTSIRWFGIIVGVIMAFGAVFGALNAMYTAVSTRTAEIATLRALGFGAFSVVASVLLESLLLAGFGGVLGGLVAFALFDGTTVSTLNNGSFSQVAFAFAVTPSLLVLGVVLALILGLLGGLLPSVRAATQPISEALRAR
ncbi:MAG: FtsX-like permease family protein [Pseudomonadota bacterium]